MLMVISPAKTLDYQRPVSLGIYTQPQHLAEAQTLVNLLLAYGPAELAELMQLSDKLAALNMARYGSWQTPFSPENARQALLAFKGDVYTGLNADDFSEADFAQAQQQLRILSGLYGVLRPLDLMQAYRLEMGTKLANPHGKDLYAFWGERITQWLNEELEQHQHAFLLNLASNEYFSAVKRPLLRAQIIDTEFRDRKDGQYKIISIYAKRARGLMARYVIQQRLNHPDALCEFDSEGYYYSPAQSSPERMVFLRDGTPR
jgi:uncharacterized protein